MIDIITNEQDLAIDITIFWKNLPEASSGELTLMRDTVELRQVRSSFSSNYRLLLCADERRGLSNRACGIPNKNFNFALRFPIKDDRISNYQIRRDEMHGSTLRQLIFLGFLVHGVGQTMGIMPVFRLFGANSDNAAGWAEGPLNKTALN
jgi:hypothetical protein